MAHYIQAMSPHRNTRQHRGIEPIDGGNPGEPKGTPGNPLEPETGYENGIGPQFSTRPNHGPNITSNASLPKESSTVPVVAFKPILKQRAPRLGRSLVRRALTAVPTEPVYRLRVQVYLTRRELECLEALGQHLPRIVGRQNLGTPATLLLRRGIHDALGCPDVPANSDPCPVVDLDD